MITRYLCSSSPGADHRLWGIQMWGKSYQYHGSAMEARPPPPYPSGCLGVIHECGLGVGLTGGRAGIRSRDTAR